MKFEPLEKPKEQSKKGINKRETKAENKQNTAKLCDN